MNNYIKPDNEYCIVNDYNQLTRKGYELIIWQSGSKYYCLNGQLHRESQPSASGSSQNAPAVIYSNGAQVWFIHGKLHRLDGPAIIYDDGEKNKYFIDHKYYDENEFWTVQKKCFKCYQIFNNLYDLKIHLEQYDDHKNMIEYIYELILG